MNWCISIAIIMIPSQMHQQLFPCPTTTSLTLPLPLPLPSVSLSHLKTRVAPISSSSTPPTPHSQILSNATRRRRDPTWTAAGFSLGVDLGSSRTGLALSKGFSPRPLAVLELRGEKLELRLLEIAEQEEVDEFVIGLPISYDGKENQQSNKVRSIAGRFAVRAANEGLRVYLQDEHGSTLDALDFMIDNYEGSMHMLFADSSRKLLTEKDNYSWGLKKSARRGRIDAYSAAMVLERYYSMSGGGAELVLPKQPELQEKLLKGPCRELDF